MSDVAPEGTMRMGIFDAVSEKKKKNHDRLLRI